MNPIELDTSLLSLLPPWYREVLDYQQICLTEQQQFEALAEERDGLQPRRALTLSQGTADQLYLAVRLAVCELVLPAEEPCPLVLDDALANFDDSRCAAALQFLKEAAGNRQILLFTCHSREGEFFAGDREVFVQRLTDAAVEV